MDGTYAPQSPDLSGFLTSPPKQQQQYQPHPHQHQHQHQPTSRSQPSGFSYAPRSPVLPAFPNAPQAHNINHNLNSYQSNNQQAAFGVGGNEFSEYGTNQYMPPIPALPPSHSFPSNTVPTNTIPSYYTQLPQSVHTQPHPAHIKTEENFYSPSAANDEYLTSPTNTMTSRAPRQPRGQPSSSSFGLQQPPQYKNPNPNNIEIKTKFPVARIKRIMQADEEVGKVAQVTPVAVSKALELFMISLVSGAAEKAREKGGKRVTAQHLKQVVMASPEQFDFLNEIVGRVSEAQEGAGGEGRKRKEKVENSEESEEEVKKAIKKGKGRRKKSEE